MAVLIAGRLVQGLGSGAMNVAIYVCVAMAFSPRQRPKMFTYISTAWVSAVVRRSTGVGLADAAAELALGVLCGHSARHLWRSNGLPQSAAHDAVAPSARTQRNQTRTVVGCRTSGRGCHVARSLLVSGWTGSHSAWRLQAVWRCFLWRCPRSCHPGFLRFRRGLTQVIQTRGSLAGAFFGAEAFVPLMLVEQRAVPLLQAGVVLTVGSVGWTVGSWLQVPAMASHPARRLITLGCVSVALGLGWSA